MWFRFTLQYHGYGSEKDYGFNFWIFYHIFRESYSDGWAIILADTILTYMQNTNTPALEYFG